MRTWNQNQIKKTGKSRPDQPQSGNNLLLYKSFRSGWLPRAYSLFSINIPYDLMPNNCIDYYVESGLAFPGGNPFNVAVYLRRLGAEASYLGAVGTDNYGDLLLNRLHEKGVDISHVQRLSGNTALCNVNVVNGERVLGDYDEGVMASFSLRQSDYEFLKGFDLVVTGLWGHVESSLERIRKQCVPVAFDCADRPFDPAGRIALQHTDIAFFSDDHLDGEALENKIQDVDGYGPEIVVATRGVKGSVAFDGKQFFSCPPADCVLVDTMGAGDSFIAGFLFAWLQRTPLMQCMKKGAENAAITISYSGAW